LLVVPPIALFNVEFLLGLTSPLGREFLFDNALDAFDKVKLPLIFALIGWGLGSLARAILKQWAAAV
jgi:hypothetical protein